MLDVISQDDITNDDIKIWIDYSYLFYSIIL